MSITTNAQTYQLSPKASTLLLFLQSKANRETNSSFWRRNKIAELCDFSLSSFSRALRELKQRNLITVNKRYDLNGRQMSNEYILLSPNESSCIIKENVSFQPPEDVDTNIAEKRKKRAIMGSLRAFRCDEKIFNLKGNALKVYLYLLDRCGGVNKSFGVRKKDIAKSCGISTATVYRSIVMLQEKKYIAIKPQTREALYGNKGQTANLYTILQMPETTTTNLTVNKISTHYIPKIQNVFKICYNLLSKKLYGVKTMEKNDLIISQPNFDVSGFSKPTISLLFFLQAHVDENNTISLPRKEIARLIGMSESSVIRGQRELKAKGVLLSESVFNSSGKQMENKLKLIKYTLTPQEKKKYHNLLDKPAAPTPKGTALKVYLYLIQLVGIGGSICKSVSDKSTITCSKGQKHEIISISRKLSLKR